MLLEKSHLCLRFHAFSDNIEAKVLGHIDNSAHQGCVARLDGHIADKALVDFKLVER